VNLLGDISLSNWTGEDVQSYEPEDTLMKVPVRCDECSFHETHVRLKRQRIGESRACASAADTVQSHETFEIRNLRWLVQSFQRCGRRLGGEMVDEDAERRNASRNRLWVGALASALTRVG
jgi:hypothetical protein